MIAFKQNGKIEEEKNFNAIKSAMGVQTLWVNNMENIEKNIYKYMKNSIYRKYINYFTKFLLFFVFVN